MGRWTAHTRVGGVPEEVLALLTTPDAIARWSPIDFEVLDFDGDRLAPGDRVRVEGALAGRMLAFDVEVADADDGRLRLTAVGPIRIDVEYIAVARDYGSDIRASVAVSGRGLIGGLLARATEALLAAGTLHAAVGRIAGELEPALAAA